MKYVLCQSYQNNLLDALISDSPLIKEELQQQIGDLLSFLTPADSAYTMTDTGVYDEERQVEMTDQEFQKKKQEPNK